MTESDTLTLYKMIVLYALSRVPYPLTRSQITDFFLEKDYTGYLTLQSVLAQLCEAGFTEQKPVRNRTQLLLTEDGRNVLSMFDNELTAEIKADIDDYLKKHSHTLQMAASVTSDSHRDPKRKDSYVAELALSEQGHSLLSLTLPSLPRNLRKRSVRTGSSATRTSMRM